MERTELLREIKMHRFEDEIVGRRKRFEFHRPGSPYPGKKDYHKVRCGFSLSLSRRPALSYFTVFLKRKKRGEKYQEWIFMKVMTSGIDRSVPLIKTEYP